MTYVTDYRPWKDQDKEAKVVFFFDKRMQKPKLIAEHSADEIDEMLNIK
jgi:hypothetical protein